MNTLVSLLLICHITGEGLSQGLRGKGKVFFLLHTAEQGFTFLDESLN